MKRDKIKRMIKRAFNSPISMPLWKLMIVEMCWTISIILYAKAVECDGFKLIALGAICQIIALCIPIIPNANNENIKQ